uniref:Putative secreted protein n=1 Tax=Anopheles triannulatus TaxID=58253 RepID=A0A2M4B1P5_9DIPT
MAMTMLLLLLPVVYKDRALFSSHYVCCSNARQHPWTLGHRSVKWWHPSGNRRRHLSRWANQLFSYPRKCIRPRRVR